jgi:hypothetical protein
MPILEGAELCPACSYGAVVIRRYGTGTARAGSKQRTMHERGVSYLNRELRDCHRRVVTTADIKDARV